jgi:O-antigen ligase
MRLHLARIELPIALGAISLFASVTGLIPISVTFALMILLLPALLWRGWPPSRLVVATLSLFGMLLLSTLFYDPLALFDPSFLRRDGNGLITLLPLLIFGAWKLPYDAERLGRSFLLWSGAINGLCILAYLVIGNFHSDEPLYLFLFVAHNAAGGFLATASALCIGYYVATRDKLILLAALSHLLGLLLTNSRGSELGLLAALILHFLCHERRRWWIAATIVAAVALALLINWSYPFYKEGRTSVERPNPNVTELEVERSYTVLVRLLYIWPKAVDLWLSSPIVGTGFGSFNDEPIELRGIPYLFSWNANTERIYDDAHAHQTYLHILAETGLLGLILLLWLLTEMRRSCRAIPSPALRRALLLALATAIWSSWTEHRLFTPSQMLPITLLLSLSLIAAKERVAIVKG